MKKFLTQSAKTAFLAILFGAIAVYAQTSFVGPTGTPANSNAPLPINTSQYSQIKGGSLQTYQSRVGAGTTLPLIPTSNQSGILQVDNKVGVGTGIDFATVPVNGLKTMGRIFSGGFYWTPTQIGAGIAALGAMSSTSPVPDPGSIFASKFCFSLTTCISAWPTGGSGTTLSGATNNTVRFSALDTPVAATNLLNDGNSVTVGKTLILDAGLTASQNFRVTANNKNFVEFWTNMSNTYAGIIAESINLKGLTTVPSISPLCVYPGGNVTTCGSSGSGATVNVGSGVYRVPRYDIGGLSLSGSANLTNDDITVKIGETQPATATRLDVSGGAIQINNAPLKVSLSGSGNAGTDAISLNTSTSSGISSIITNRPGLNFWSSEGGGHNADVYVRDVHVGGDILIPGNIWSGGSVTAPFVSGMQLRSPTLAAGSAGYKAICADNIGSLVWCPPANSTSGVQTYTSVGSSTWTVPAGVTTARIQVWGGGGGGAGGYASLFSGSGGGGGGGAGYIDANIAVSGGQSYSVTVGQGGSGGMFGQPGNGGTNGVNSVFNSTYIATGGKGAPAAALGTANGGLGGIPTAPTGIALSGFSGAIGVGSASYTGGTGGSSGGGVVYGKGGNGGVGGNAAFSQGLAGTSGAVIITYN